MHCSTVSRVTRVTSPSRSPFSTAISRVERAVRASPFAKTAIMRSTSSSIWISSFPKPFGLSIALLRSFTRSSSVRAFKTNTLHLERRALFTSKDGFSVVAPMSIMLPFSTKGRNASCWALLKRWISSTKTMVFTPNLLLSSACCITVLISFMPLVTAEKFTNSAFVWFAITLARVVFPTPGGPQNIMDDTASFSMILLRIFPFPIKCC